MSLKNAFRHFKTITRHRHEVIKGCAKAGIFWQGLRHDLSKYSPTEFLSGARYYQGDRSPNDREREEHGCSRAWMHHMGRNLHHFEYWHDYDPQTKRMTPVKMPEEYVVEMFCDRIAASKIYQGKNYTDRSALTYFENGKPRREDMIHPASSDLLEKLLVMLAENGEEETFSFIRQMLKEVKKNRKKEKRQKRLDNQ